MSKISAQCDELRKWADQLSERENEFGVMVRALAASLREAADTIWELRCRLVDAEARIRKLGELCKLCEREAENAALREECDGWKKLCVDQEVMHIWREETLDGDNAKLRELAERAWKSAERLCQAFDGPCRDDGVTIDKPCPMGERDEECVYGQLQRELRECGVEVDG